MNLTPYLTFNGQCRQAMEFYAEVLGADIEMMSSFGDMPSQNNPMEPANKKHIMHARLRKGEFYLMASDSFDGKGDYAYSGVSLSLAIDDLDEAKAIYDKLAQGGRATMPFSPTFWAKGFGTLQDKFGIRWMINCE